MQLTTYTVAGEFLADVQSTLEEQETANSLLLGLAQRLHDHPDYYTTKPYLATVHDGPRLVVVALMTPPHKLLVTGMANSAFSSFALVAEDLLAGGWAAPGVNGPAQWSTAFAREWSTRSGQRATVAMRLRAYQLEQVDPPTYPRGMMRPATAADAPLLAGWLQSFGRETGTDPNADIEAARASVERALAYGSFYLWDDGGAVALAGKGRPTRHSVAIGPVYTPPAARRRGYASALVAMLSQRLLQEGKRYITLFTDLANPTANHIYQQIGFRPLVDFVEFEFSST